MNGESSRGPPSQPRDRHPPPPEPSYRHTGSARDEASRLRSHPATEQRYSRSEMDNHLPAHSRGATGWTDNEHPTASASYATRAEPMPASRPYPPYSRAIDPPAARSGPYPPSDLPGPPRAITRPDDYYGAPQPSLSSNRDSSSSSTSSRQFHRRPSHFDDDIRPIDGHGVSMPDSRDPHRSPKRHSGDPKLRLDGYADPFYYHGRPPMNHAATSRSDYGISRVRSPGEMQPAYPVASPPRRVSNASPPPYPLGLADGSLHRDKRARLDLYSERAQPATEAMLRPPPLRAASSYRSIASTASSSTGWHDRSDLHERRPRDGADAPYHVEGASKGARTVEWATAEGAHPSRRTSAMSHHTLDAGTTASSEVPSLHSQSSKVKRRKRAVLSCTECKQRKIKCDRNVPNCGSCVRRGVAHLCRWGDERDYLPAAPASNITPSNAALMARIAQLESQVRVLQSSPNSPSAVHAVAASERSLGQRGVSKYGASESSSGPSSRFSGQSGIQRPPDFTSRDRNATTRGEVNDGRFAYDDEEEDEDESEQSDESAESGAENAGDLLRALATGTSLKNNSRQGPPRREPTAAQDGQQADSVQEDGQNGLSTGVKRESRADARQSDGRVGRGPSSSNRRRSLLPEEDLASAAMFSIFSTDASGSRKYSIRSGLLEALNLLPPRHKTEALVDHYLREAEAVVSSFHRPSLLRELSAFWTAYDQMKDATTPASTPLPDLQFGALLLAVCEAACEFMTPAEVLDSEICDSRTSINDGLAMLARSCLALLGMGQFVRRPNIWGMQAVIVLRHYAFNRDHREEYAVLFTMAIKAAEFMGLHRLGSALTDEDRWEDEMRERARLQASGTGKGTGSSSSHRWKLLTSTQVADGHETESDGEDLDPDRDERKDMNAMWLPRGSKRRKWNVAAAKRYKEGSRVSREHGRKVWFALATLDWLCASHFDRVYHCTDEMFTTQSPQNIDDSDLTDSDSIAFEANNDRAPGRNPRVSNAFLDKIRVTSIPTTNSYIPIHIEICHTVRSISDALNQGEESFDAVLAIEARFREILRSLPRFYKLDGESEYDPEIHRLHKERPYLSTQRAIIHENVHHRLLKLHRLYMSRGYWNAKYIHSTRTCIESARVVIGVLRALDSVGCRGQRYWIVKFHIFHAVLALQVDLLYLARQPVNRETLAKRADVVAGLKMLHARTDVEGRNPILASSLKVIKVLREEEQARRSKIRASAEASAGSEPNSVASPAGSAESQKRSKGREWTGASESTGDLADHLDRRVRETWYTVEADKLRARAEAASNLAADARSPISELPAQASAPTPTASTEDGSSLWTTDGLATAVPQHNDDRPDGRDTELDDYLKLLSSYQNPDDAPDGAHFFDVLDDMVFENGSASKVQFGGRAVQPPLPLLRGANDLAAAGAGFDAFTAA